MKFSLIFATVFLLFLYLYCCGIRRIVLSNNYITSYFNGFKSSVVCYINFITSLTVL